MLCRYVSQEGSCVGSDGWYNTEYPDCGVWETWNEICTQCFASGTKIRLINGEEKNIENLKRGEQILAFDENLNLKTAHVTNIIKKIASSYTILITNEGTKVTTTSTHPFLTKNSQFKKVSELKEGDIIYILKNKKLNPERIYQKQEFFQPIQVYNLSVNNPNTFFANSFAVHNKDPTICAYSISEDRQQECR